MLVKSEIFKYKDVFHTLNGNKIDNLTISYQTYGKLNRNKDNAILICHYFSGDKHIAGKYSDNDETAGWWDSIVGPGKPFDTERFFIISSDSLCCVVNSDKVMTSSPRDINPEKDRPYGMDFPVITIQDMVYAQNLLIEHFGIKKLFAVSGPSMGGLQALTWAFLFPEKVHKCIPVAAADKVDCFSCFFPLRMGIESIKNDPKFNNGNYYTDNPDDVPLQGLKGAINGLALIARGRNWGEDILGGKTWINKDPYNSVDNMFEFERNIIEGVGARAAMYDPNSYIYLSKANLLFDLFHNIDDKDHYLSKLHSEFLFLADTGDIFILPEHTKRLSEKLECKGIRSFYHEFTSPLGHLGSVSNAELFSEYIYKFLNN